MPVSLPKKSHPKRNNKLTRWRACQEASAAACKPAVYPASFPAPTRCHNIAFYSRECNVEACTQP